MKIKLFARTPDDADKLIRSIDKQFRSSSRYIPALTLFEESYLKIRAEKLRALHELSQADVVASLRRLQKPLKLNRGVVENLLKIHQFTQLCGTQRSIVPTEREQYLAVSTYDGVSGLPQARLDKLIEGFPERTPRLKREFDYGLSRLVQMGVRDAFDNDWYKFKMAAVAFEHRLHERLDVTYAMFSRGKQNRAYFVVGGTSLAIDALPYFRFREDEVQYLSRHPQFARVSPEFFNHLRTWRFKGQVRAVPEGTVAFANEPLMEITTDPVSATLVECLLSPIVDTVTTSATKVSRIVNAARGVPVVEGGTRRSGHGLLGAYGALIGLATGTSNTKISQILGTLPYGSMEHALFGLFPNELRTLIAYDRMFPNSTALVDENDIMDGLRLAVIASGRGLGGVRTDSEMPGIGMAGTTRAMRDFLDDLGYYDAKVLISNRIDEFELLKSSAESAAYQSVLVGTAAQSPPDANGSNIVYKLVETRDLNTGEVRPIAKRSVGKVGIPGRTDVFRVSAADGRATHDVIAIAGATVPGGTPLLEPALDEYGQRSLPRVTIAETAARTRAQLGALPAEVLDVHARAGVYPVRIAADLQQKTARVLSEKEDRVPRIGIHIETSDQNRQARLVERTRALYRLDRQVTAPGGPSTVAKVRADILKSQKDAWIFVVMAGDDFAAHAWSARDRALFGGDYGWVIHRTGDDAPELPTDLLDEGWESLGPYHLEHARTGAVIHAVDVNVGAPAAAVGPGEVDTIFHGVDLQWTFWEAIGNRAPGALAVPGSNAILANVLALTTTARDAARVKSILSKDFHFEIERRDPKWNGEFHAPQNFPAHGMAAGGGPAGHELLWEVRSIFGERIVDVPHHHEVGDALVPKAWDASAHRDRLFDADVQVILQKNGPGSYDFAVNPRAREIVDQIRPRRVYVYGVATDFCVRAAALAYRAWGYDTFVVGDAIAGLNADQVARTMTEWRAAGVKLVTCAEVLREFVVA